MQPKYVVGPRKNEAIYIPDNGFPSNITVFCFIVRVATLLFAESLTVSPLSALR